MGTTTSKNDFIEKIFYRDDNLLIKLHIAINDYLYHYDELNVSFMKYHLLQNNNKKYVHEEHSSSAKFSNLLKNVQKNILKERQTYENMEEAINAYMKNIRNYESLYNIIDRRNFIIFYESFYKMNKNRDEYNNIDIFIISGKIELFIDVAIKFLNKKL